ncbi:MAG: alpha/beta hydrolase [Pseudooceanicola sp.]|nr:alpha/beta hydrolase [Pseudooceanicola sp.]
MPDHPTFDPAPYFSDVDEGPAGGDAVWARTSDGVRIRVGLWPLAGARGTVLLFPGRTEYIEKYGPAAGDLAARGYATLTVDWRGQGIADRLTKDPLKGHVGDFDEYQRDVQAALAVAKHFDLPRPWHLLGHSMGGCIGLRALHDGVPVASASFTGPMWGIGMPAAMRPLAWALGVLGTLVGRSESYAPGVVRDAYVLIQSFEGNNLTNDPDMYDFMIRQTRAHPEIALAGVTYGWLNAALKETSALARLPAPAVPGLTFLGSDEGIVDVAAVQTLMARWPNGRLEIIEHGRHEVLMDTPGRRRALFDAMAAHFDAHSGATTPRAAAS